MQKLAIPANPDGTMYIYASQGENKARSYEVTIIDISGKPVELDGTTAVFYVHKGENIVQIPMEIEGNTATATLTSGACDLPGDHPCWVQVIKPDAYDLRVDGLVLRVQACDIEGAVDASDEWGQLTQLIVQAQQAIDNANTAAGQAETAADSANIAANAANSAADTANTAASNAQIATSAASNAANQASTAAGDAQSNGDYAKTQGDAAKAIVEQWEGVGIDDFVPITRTINGKPLSSDISLTPSDIGAQPQTAAKNSMIKADSSGNLIAAVDGTDYITGEIASLELQPNVQLNLAGELSNAVRAGNIVTVNFGLKVTAAFEAYQALAYIPENLRNASRFVRFTIWINNTPALGNVYGNGAINASVSIPINATVLGSFSYPISV